MYCLCFDDHSDLLDRHHKGGRYTAAATLSLAGLFLVDVTMVPMLFLQVHNIILSRVGGYIALLFDDVA